MVLVICGVGKVNACIATQVLIDQFAVTHIVLTGAAGGLDDRVEAFESNVEAVSLNALALVEGLLVGLQSSLH